jgi:hypothetical protein
LQGHFKPCNAVHSAFGAFSKASADAASRMEWNIMRRYLFNIYAAGVVSRDEVGRKYPSDGPAVAYGQRIVDELTKDDDYCDAVIDVVTASGRLVARLISSETPLVHHVRQPTRQISLH